LGYNFSPMSGEKLTHLDESGQARMVDVGAKPASERVAVARGEVVLRPETVALIRQGLMKKGDVLGVARVAGIMAAKKTSELIPLCHPIALTKVDVDLELADDLPGVRISASARTVGQTGVEMEALTAVTVAALTVYDMVKAVERKACIQNVRLVEKHGGQSGDIINE
jgi:cyclic pyranopterin monophosphate synthase